MIKLNGKGEKVYVDAKGHLVVEWYDFGNDALYEFADLLIFDDSAQGALAIALGNDTLRGLPLAKALVARIDSYHQIKKFVQKQELPFKHEIDYNP